MALAAWVLGVAFVLGCAAGLLIGAVGVGGIILVPILIQFPDVGIQRAIASCMFSYIFAGIAGATAYWKNRDVEWKSAGLFAAFAAPGAFVAAFILQYVDDFIVKCILYSVVFLSACFSLYRTLMEPRPQRQSDNDNPDGAAPNGEPTTSPDPQSPPSESSSLTSSQRRRRGCSDTSSIDEDSEASVGYVTDLSYSLDTFDRRHPPSSKLGFFIRASVGLLVGFGSALTGSSGPVLLLPSLLPLHWDVVQAMATAQLIQLPIAAAATISYVALRPHVIDFELGASIAAGLVPLVFVGAWLVTFLAVRTMKLLVSGVLVIAAIALMGQLIASAT